MAPLTSSNGLHRHQAGESSGGQQDASNTNDVAPKFHQIPFQATPVQHGPTPLNFGFGFGSALGSPPSTQSIGQASSLQWGQSPQTSQIMSPSHRYSPSSRGSTTAVSGRRNETKRRRDSDDEDSDDDMEGGREKSASPMSHHRVIVSKQALPKRMRAGIGAVGMINLEESRSSRGTATPTDNTGHTISAGPSTSSAIDKMDLGKILCE